MCIKSLREFFFRRGAKALILSGSVACMLAIASCGGKGPTAPSNPPTAAPPAPPPPPPLQSFTEVEGVFPSAPATVSAAQPWVTVTVAYGVSQNDMEVAKAANETYVVTACPSLDGKTALPVCDRSIVTSNNGRATNLRVGISHDVTPDVNETDYIIAYLAIREATPPGVQPKPDQIVTSTVTSARMVFHWN